MVIKQSTLFLSPGMWTAGGGLSFSLLSLLTSLLSLVLVQVWLFLMYKSYKGEMYKLPVIGNLTQQNLWFLSATQTRLFAAKTAAATTATRATIPVNPGIPSPPTPTTTSGLNDLIICFA